MYFKISRNKLSELISVASKAISPNSPIASLSGIKFDIYQDSIELTGSDNDISIKVSAKKGDDFTYEVKETGSIVINKNYITEIIRKIDSDIVEIEVTDGNLAKITGNAAMFEINGYSAGEYPLIDFTEPEKKFNIEGKVLKKLVDQTYFATSVQEARPALSGINFSCDPSGLRVVATDSYRLAKKKLELGIPYDFNVTILAKSLIDISRTFAEQDKISFALSEQKAQFRSENTVIQTRLIEGTYPDTSKFVPNSFDYELILSSKDLLKALDSFAFMKNENDQFAIVKLNLSSSEIIMSAKSQEIGSAVVKLPFDEYKGKSLEISFSAKYMQEAVSGLGSEKIKIRFAGAMKPFVLTAIDDNTSLQLVLPVRTFN